MPGPLKRNHEMPGVTPDHTRIPGWRSTSGKDFLCKEDGSLSLNSLRNSRHNRNQQTEQKSISEPRAVAEIPVVWVYIVSWNNKQFLVDVSQEPAAIRRAYRAL